ncbi:HaeIII family restriction endonuclease [Cysteiniphilum sp. JM-1]|uniref:HaeIII family restriction endonuclease n=1 Tax=Cysteiniphilum sp. JM-1 TaxID=2610891 RepID=UPI001245EA9C|nr:HaeIII family restriction endonuclease [Cysteiniphilum sp. JM-1]
MSKQMMTGKAFEYALLKEFKEKLHNHTTIEVIENSSFFVAQACFDKLLPNEQSRYLLTSSFAVNFLMDIEPRLANDFGKEDVLQLEILSDQLGQGGDVRDVLIVRLLQKWEIGISAKNNHHAVKHSRLSNKLDFGEKWLNMKSSEKYFENIYPIFSRLKKIKEESQGIKKWSEIGDYHEEVYKPILIAFKHELIDLYNQSPSTVPINLLAYLVGRHDFYKVIQNRKGVEIQAYNLYGTLNLSFRSIAPKFQTPLVKAPTKILDLSFKSGSKNTLILSMDNDWKISFRIHNASSKVEPSLKFDIQLLSSPKTLFKNKLSIQSKGENENS